MSCDTGAKGKAVVSSAGTSYVAAVGPPTRPDLQSVSKEKCAVRIQPLSGGKPYFACIMCKSHVQPPFQVVVPKSLAPFLPLSTVPATLTWCGRSWDMRLTGGRQIQRLEAGWRGFALENGLRLGDGCVFELLDGAVGGGTVKFSVQVLPSTSPQRSGRGPAGIPRPAPLKSTSSTPPPRAIGPNLSECLNWIWTGLAI